MAGLRKTVSTLLRLSADLYATAEHEIDFDVSAISKYNRGYTTQILVEELLADFALFKTF
jgi:hypothetical protein